VLKVPLNPNQPITDIGLSVVNIVFCDDFSVVAFSVLKVCDSWPAWQHKRSTAIHAAVSHILGLSSVHFQGTQSFEFPFHLIAF